MLMAPFFDTVLASVEPHETGSASGTLTAVQQLGSALGIAVLGTIFFSISGMVDAFETVLWIEAGTLVVGGHARDPASHAGARADGTLPLDARAG